jgi:RimJ/RimL family protein N-acetyltransferase
MSAEGLARLIDDVLRLPEFLAHTAEQGQNIVDGQGTTRVVSHMMLSAPLHLRRAEASDSRSLFEWRNHPDTRHHSLDPSEITWSVHERWFDGVLSDPDRELLIAEQEGRPVGVLRYDIKEGSARVSIYLVPGLAGRGLGTCLLFAGEEWLRSCHPEVHLLEAQIRPDNAASLGAFRSAGFTQDYAVLTKKIYDRH